MYRNGNMYNWCKWHKRHALSHTSATCRENPSHPNHEGNKKQEAAKPDLEMNLMQQQQECAPINPWISLATTDDSVLSGGDIEQAIPSTAAPVQVDEDSSAAAVEPKVKRGSHRSFWGYSS